MCYLSVALVCCSFVSSVGDHFPSLVANLTANFVYIWSFLLIINCKCFWLMLKFRKLNDRCCFRTKAMRFIKFSKDHPAYHEFSPFSDKGGMIVTPFGSYSLAAAASMGAFCRKKR